MRATFSWIDSRRGPITVSAILRLFLTLFACLLATPVISGDTDLWYHLTGGRHLFEQGTLYNPYINSFIEPAKDFTNYFWGFQLLAQQHNSFQGRP